ncbi:MAG: SigF/SigG family RNA polymerase sporulation sigma factor [Eubacteriales bacterium]
MDQTISLIKQAHLGDKDARERVINDNVGLIWCVVKRFTGRGTELDDLFQIGSIGLLKAVDKFDFTYDVKFSTYAVPMIAGEIKRFLRDDSMIKVSRSLKELAAKAYMKREELIAKGHTEPSVEELANILEVDKEDLIMAIESGSEVESLYKPIYQKDGDEICLMDKMGKVDGQEDEIVNKLLLRQILETLEIEERRLVHLRYFLNMTQTEVGRELGISQVQVSRLEKKILRNLRNNL